MKVKNMTGRTGRPVANQFIIDGATFSIMNDEPENQEKSWISDEWTGEVFQSYNSVIALKAHSCGNTGNCCQVFLDRDKWDYSTTTGKYRNQFLGETKKDTERKIKDGVYILTDLNNY